MSTTQRGKRRLTLRVISTLLLLLLLSVFFRLAWWQYDRAQEKISIQSEVHERISQPPMDLSQLIGELGDDLSGSAEHLRYQSIRISGTYDTAHQFLFDSQARKWQRGYAVITPFVLDSGQTLLINRGWLVQPPSKDALPDLNIAQPEQTLVGKIDLPNAAQGNAKVYLEEQWPQRIQSIDYELIAQRLGRSVAPVIVRLAADQQDGYDRIWQPAIVGPMKHYGYMAQWLAMALAVIFFYIKLSAKRDNAEAAVTASSDEK